jgi:lipoate-protein ligase B
MAPSQCRGKPPGPTTGLPLRWHGRVPYAEGLTLQDAAWEEVRGGAPFRWLGFEHDPVITAGRHAELSDLHLPAEQLAARGVDVVRTDRGGRLTWHGPGQLVGYPIVDLRALRTGPRRYVERLAGALTAYLGELGIEATWRDDAPGVWVDGGSRKIASVGVRVREGITTHGFALNLDPPADAFAALSPCGMSPSVLTSVAALRAGAPTPEAAARALSPWLAAALGR